MLAGMYKVKCADDNNNNGINNDNDYNNNNDNNGNKPPSFDGYLGVKQWTLPTLSIENTFQHKNNAVR